MRSAVETSVVGSEGTAIQVMPAAFTHRNGDFYIRHERRAGSRRPPAAGVDRRVRARHLERGDADRVLDDGVVVFASTAAALVYLDWRLALAAARLGQERLEQDRDHGGAEDDEQRRERGVLDLRDVERRSRDGGEEAVHFVVPSATGPTAATTGPAPDPAAPNAPADRREPSGESERRDRRHRARWIGQLPFLDQRPFEKLDRLQHGH